MRWMGDPFGVASDPFNDRFWGAVASATMAGQNVTSESALQLDVVQSTLGRLAGTISTLPMMVFERLPDGSKRPATEHPLYELLHGEPNRYQTAQEYREEQVGHLTWWRNAYSVIHPSDAGDPVGSLEQIHPSRVAKIERRSDGRVYYTVNRLAPASGQDIYRDDEMWHIRKAPLTVDGLRGQYMWESSRETFGRAQAVEQFGALYFKNGGSGGGVLKHPGSFKSKEDEEAFLSAWRNGGSGLNRHRDRLLLYGVDYTPFAVNNDEAQFIETMKEVSIKLCRLWNMPPHMVGILDRATFSNIEQQSTEFVVYTLAPWIAALEQAARKDLLIGDDKKKYFVEFNVAGLLRGDFKTRMQGYAWGRQWGWISVNDVRRLENMPPIGPAGDRYLEPMNMSPVGAPGADAESVQPGGPSPFDPADNPNDQAP